MTKRNNESSYLTIFFVALTCILTGGFIGATANMINGAVSPYYFKVIMHWNFQNIWTASVAQGIWEGLLYGVIFAVIFTTGFGIITKGKAPYSFAVKQLLKIIVFTFFCWAIGGFLAMLLATLSPDFYRANFPFTPMEKAEILKFAWVGGSIWGVMIGGLISAIIGIVLTKINWKKIATKQ